MLAILCLITAKHNSEHIALVKQLLGGRIDELIKANIDVGRVQERNVQEHVESSDWYKI
jgi:hypothetical protein